MEKINNLFLHEEVQIFQDAEGFNFSLDSILLAQFVNIKKDSEKILDIGTGNAPIPLILTLRTKAKIIGVEVQKSVCSLAKKTVAHNKKKAQIEIIEGDIKEISEQFANESFATIVCNPPFFQKYEKTKRNKQETKVIARHEILLSLEDIFSVSKKLLINGGNIALVHRPERLIEIISLMKKNNIEPKRIKMVYPKKDKNANILLIEGRKNGKPGLIVEPVLIVHREDGAYSEAVISYLKEE